MQEHVKRMVTERDDLKGKISRAKKAILNPPFGATQKAMQLLEKQLGFMEQYLEVLEERISYEGA